MGNRRPSLSCAIQASAKVENMPYDDGLFYVSDVHLHEHMLYGRMMVVTVRSLVDGTREILSDLEAGHIVQTFDALTSDCIHPVFREYLIELDCEIIEGELDFDAAWECRSGIVAALKAEFESITILESTFSVLHKF